MNARAILAAVKGRLFGIRPDTPDTGVDDPRTIPPRRDTPDATAEVV